MNRSRCGYDNVLSEYIRILSKIRTQYITLCSQSLLYQLHVLKSVGYTPSSLLQQ